jgi:hypothetical protein
MVFAAIVPEKLNFIGSRSQVSDTDHSSKMALFAKKSLINANNRARCVPPTLVLGHLPVRPVEALAGCSTAGAGRQRATGTVAAGQHPRLAGAHPLVHQHKALGIGADVGAQQAAAARHYAWEEWIDKFLYAIFFWLQNFPMASESLSVNM